MNEVEELLKLDPKDLPALKPLILDDLHQKALKNLYLELGRGPVLCLLSPSFAVLSPASDARIHELVSHREPLLAHLKDLLIQSLAAYSALLEVNSYSIEQNNYLLLARVGDKDSGGGRFEINYYTHSPHEIQTRYEDKIYIGRDFTDLFNFKRKYFGVRELIASLQDQSGKLAERADEKLKKPADYASFFKEIRESVTELNAEALAILEPLPPVLDLAKLTAQDLIDINAQYRTINHFLIELHDEVGDFEALLRAKMEKAFVRYVTKYQKDVTNLISYFNIKINGSLGQSIGHLAHKG
jgi:Mg2+ and Co2+ transporter CorA